MFPLAHNFLAEKILKSPRCKLQKPLTPFQKNLMMVGSVLPDLVAGMGMERNFGHLMGRELYAFCGEKHPAALPLALGVWLHGADPCGFDYYADEHWGDGKGWCFQKCVPYIDDVVAACNLPAEWGLWKAHNFVEMAAEIQCDKKCPELGRRLLAAVADEDVIKLTADVLADFAGADRSRVRSVLQITDEMFSIKTVTAEDLGEKYAMQLIRRHEIYGADAKKAADVILHIESDLKDEFWLWYQQTEDLIWQNISREATFLTNPDSIQK